MANKPKLNLKELKKQGQIFGVLNEAVKAPAGHQQINPYLAYLKQVNNVPDTELTATHDLIWDRPMKTGEYLTQYLSKHQKKIISEVKKDPRAVISKLEQDTLLQLAEPHLGDDSYKLRAAISERGQPNVVRDVTMTLYQSDSWKQVVSGSSTDALRDALAKEVERARKGHQEKDLGFNIKTGKIDKNKTAAYLAPKIAADDEGILKLGLIYSDQA